MLVATQGLTYFVGEHILYYQNTTITETQSAIIGLIYEKILKVSPATNHRFKTGNLITFVQVDIQKTNFLCIGAPALVRIPLLLLGGFFYLYKYIGFVFIVGLGVFFFGLVINLFIQRRNAKLQKQYMKAQQERVSMLSECLQSIKTIKIFSWVDIFED